MRCDFVSQCTTDVGNWSEVVCLAVIVGGHPKDASKSLVPRSSALVSRRRKLTQTGNRNQALALQIGAETGSNGDPI